MFQYSFEIKQLEEILPKIHKLQDFMVSVATAKLEKNEVSKLYSEIYLDVDCNIDLLIDDGVPIQNPNSFRTLDEWKNYYRISIENTYSVRRKYIYDLYADLVIFINDYLQKKALQQSSIVDLSNFTSNILSSIIDDSQKIQKTLTIISTTNLSDIDIEEQEYSQTYQSLLSSIRILQHLGIPAENPNNFHSLWYWHSYYSSNLPNHAGRRVFISKLYNELIQPINKSTFVHDKKQTSIEELIQDLRRRFSESISGCFSKIRLGKVIELEEQSKLRVNSQGLQQFVSDSIVVTDNTSVDLLIDFVIITAIEKEKDAIIQAFEIDEDTDREFKGSQCYWRKKIILKDNRFYEIAVTQLLDVANVDAAIATTHAITDWNSAAILMVGIAAAVDEIQQLGDVVIGEDIQYYERSKETDTGTLSQIKMHSADPSLLRKFHALPRKIKDNFPICQVRPDKTTCRPKVYAGVIASGEKVIAGEAIREEIQRGNRKIQAIEMEGYGVARAAWQSSNPCLVIRALCDYANSSKQDDWHSYAAAAAAGFTKAFLLDEPLTPRNQPTA